MKKGKFGPVQIMSHCHMQVYKGWGFYCKIMFCHFPLLPPMAGTYIYLKYLHFIIVHNFQEEILPLIGPIQNLTIYIIILCVNETPELV